MISPTRPTPFPNQVDKDTFSTSISKREALGPQSFEYPPQKIGPGSELVSHTLVPSAFLPTTYHAYHIFPRHKYPPSLSTLSKTMSGLHVVQCLCHGQMFLGNAAHSTGDMSLQPLDLSTHPELVQYLPISSVSHTDPFNQQIPGLPPTPESQLPQLTALPAVSPSIPISTQNHMPITNGSFRSASVNPTIVQPPISLCNCGLCRLPEVPQRRYQSTQISGDSDSRIGETVTFSKGGCGIRLRDAIENRLSGLVGGDDLMFYDFNVTAFSLRIEWPGYPLWTGKFRARNWGGSQGQISRARLAVQIAKRVAEFIASMESTHCTEANWKVGRDGIQIDRLVLSSVSCVSRGSWQPLLRLIP